MQYNQYFLLSSDFSIIFFIQVAARQSSQSEVEPQLIMSDDEFIRIKRHSPIPIIRSKTELAQIYTAYRCRWQMLSIKT